ncbi:GNAT family N-acetyltransferase [Flagellimonas pelagia]|nr:GNAT family N-acetyltransferase [Allomuricauda maritima]
MRHKFQKSSRYKLNKYQKRLNECFDIKPVMHDAALNLDEFNKIFEKFRSLLVKRFEGKGEHNNNLDIEEWEFYKNVAFPMIQEKKAGLFVVYNDGEPIAITLNYFSGDIIFDAITVFDIDYAKFNLGSINIMFLIQWGIKNGYKILDFSKGYFDYKTRWATKKYDFEYHILYGTKSILSKIKGKSLATLLKLKQYLREKNLNHLLNKIRFAIQPKEKSEPNAINGRTKKFIFKDYDDSNGLPLGKETVVTPETRALLFEFLYLFGENSREVEIYKLKDSDNLFVFMGKNIKKMAVAINDPLPPNYV